ncbi:hypothetical protein J6590_062129 [Homalodisca vitripennis]|nr:hypothetical protein J6590_062129 [Homalodisca vitripennis]
MSSAKSSAQFAMLRPPSPERSKERHPLRPVRTTSAFLRPLRPARTTPTLSAHYDRSGLLRLFSAHCDRYGPLRLFPPTATGPNHSGFVRPLRPALTTPPTATGPDHCCLSPITTTGLACPGLRLRGTGTVAPTVYRDRRGWAGPVVVGAVP